ncbi:MAG: VOC family protein [Cyclobacteriaceae bacterium]|nr:VOC family protein [Cyclobacteriaceae bacterium]
MKNIITPCLWFDTEAEEAANLYTSVFKNSRIDHISRYNKEGKEIHGKDSGTVMTVNFTINGQPFVALNGGPLFQFNEAVSFQIFCDTQEEIDHYWNSLTKDGGQESQCGWLKDKYGVSWQVIPSMLGELMSVPDKAEKITKTFLQMKKIDINVLEQAGR